MKKTSLALHLVAFMFFGFLANAQEKPKLIVGIVVDQMRYEMLHRFANDFGEGGFKMLMEKGTVYDSCFYAYAPTFTAPGHATIYTASLPKTHGIVANNMFDATSESEFYCVFDKTQKPTGTDDEASKCSPKHLKAPTFGDQLKRQNPKCKVISMSLKDRGAVLPGGKNADAAYWLDKYGNMVSSSFYMKKLPDWVNTFNAEGRAEKYLNQNWELLLAPEEYDESVPNAAPFESTLLNENASLPASLLPIKEKYGLKGVKRTPFGNTLLTEFALAALKSESLGQDENTDLLAISYSSTDYIGHAYGPQSVEVQDTYLRLNEELKKLIGALDAEVGRDNYVLFLTSDHGAANTPMDPEFFYTSKNDLKETLNSFCQQFYGKALIKHVANQQIWFDHEALKSINAPGEMVISELGELLLTDSAFHVNQMYTKSDLQSCKTQECAFLLNAFHPTLSGDLFYTRPFGFQERSKNYGADHGTFYAYDTHVPLLFFGKNVPTKVEEKRIGTHEIIKIVETFF